MVSDVISEGLRSAVPGGGAESELAAFQSYWDRQRRDAIVPRRADIDPRGIEPLLANAFIIERIAAGLARLRIAGSHLSDLMGMEVRGMPLSAFLEPGARDELAHYLVQLFDQPAMVRLTLSAPALQGTLLLLPLRSDLGDISRALGCLVSTGKIGRCPRRFEISGALVTPLYEGPDARVAAGLREQLELHEATATYDEHPPRASERPYLRLVKG